MTGGLMDAVTDDDPSPRPRSMGGGPDIDVIVADRRWLDGLPEAPALCHEATVAALDALGLAPLFAVLEIGVRLADDDELCDLNRRYRGRSEATNVLSFAASELIPGILPAVPSAGAPLALGDVVLARQTICAEAAAQGKPVADHLRHLTVHGVLHLAGHDHLETRDAAVMEGLEVRILAGLGVPDPYAPSPAGDSGRQPTPDGP